MVQSDLFKRPNTVYGIWCELGGEIPELLQYPYISDNSFLNIFVFAVLSMFCLKSVLKSLIIPIYVFQLTRLNIRGCFLLPHGGMDSQGYLAHHKAEQFASKGLRQAEAVEEKFDSSEILWCHTGVRGYMRLGQFVQIL